MAKQFFNRNGDQILAEMLMQSHFCFSDLFLFGRYDGLHRDERFGEMRPECSGLDLDLFRLDLRVVQSLVFRVRLLEEPLVYFQTEED